MSQNFGIAMPAAHGAHRLREPVRYVVVIESGAGMVARWLSASHALVNECDAAATEVANTTAGLWPERGALGAEWDGALQGYNAQERAAAAVYTLAT
jgi:hypothetical protein